MTRKLRFTLGYPPLRRLWHSELLAVTELKMKKPSMWGGQCGADTSTEPSRSRKCKLSREEELFESEKVYVVHLVVKKSGDVLSASCTCSAEKGEACSHIAALMFYLENIMRQEHSNLPTDTDATVHLQQWKTRFTLGYPPLRRLWHSELLAVTELKMKKPSMWGGQCGADTSTEPSRSRKCKLSREEELFAVLM